MTEIATHYELEKKLGEGEFGSVYRARDTRLDRDVALRIIPENLATDAAWNSRFRHEIRTAAAVQHPGICAIYEVNESPEQCYIAMELLEGKNLRELLHDGPLSPERILRIGIEIAEALEAAYTKGLVHGHLTPANIFVVQAGHVKILDFGLARSLSVGRSGTSLIHAAKMSAIPSEYQRSIQTAPPTVSPYMSPEQVHRETLDTRTDLFSLGTILYELAVGTPAFAGATEQLLFQEILTKNPAAPEKLNPELWSRLSELILRLLEKDRELRYQTAADVAAELKRIGRDHRLRQEISRDNASAEAPTVPDTALSATADRSDSHTNAIYRFRFLRRPALAIPSLAVIIIAAALVFLRAATTPEYLQCIELSSLSNARETVDQAAINFILKQTLSQFPDILVLTPGEFVHLQKITLEREAAKSTQRLSFFDRFNTWRRSNPKPAIRLSGSVRDVSTGLREVRFEGSARGRKIALTEQFQGTEDLLSGGIDTLAKQVLTIWSPDFTARYMENYRPATHLLSSRWDAIIHYFRGAEAWDRLDITVAERELRAAIEIDPNLALARLALGELRIFQNQWDSAQSEILAARRRAATLAETDQWRVEAFLARVFGKPLDERRYFQKVLELHPHRKEIFYELAESYFHTADVDDAIVHYHEALDLDPDYARAWNHLAYCYSWKGDHVKAIAAGRKYMELAHSANAYDSLGDIYMQAGDYENARAMKIKALELDPQIHYATRTLAFIDYMYGNLAVARDRLQSLIDVTDDRVHTAQYYADMGFLYYRAGKLNEAEQLCIHGLRLLEEAQYDVPYDELIWIRGMIAIELRNLPKAHAELERLRGIIDLGAISAANYKPAYKYWLHLNAAILAAEGGGTGKKAEAVAMLNDLKFIRNKLGYWSTPYDYAFFMDAAGLAYEKMNLTQPAEDSFREAIAYNQNFPAAHLHLAMLLLRKGEHEEARAEIELFRSIWKDDDRVFPETALAARIFGD